MRFAVSVPSGSGSDALGSAPSGSAGDALGSTATGSGSYAPGSAPSSSGAGEPSRSAPGSARRLVLFEVVRRLEARTTLLAVVVLLGLLLLGARRALLPDGFFGNAALAAACLGYRSGLARDHRDGFEAFLILNGTTVRAWVAAKLVSLAAWAVGFFVLAAAAALVVSGLGAGPTMAHAARFLVALLAAAPLVLFLEASLSTNLPFPVLLIALVTSLLLLAGAGVEPGALLGSLGLARDSGGLAAYIRLASVSTLAGAAAVTIAARIIARRSAYRVVDRRQGAASASPGHRGRATAHQRRSLNDHGRT